MKDINYTIIIDRIRKEANDVKSCFTSFSFQAIGFSGIVLSVIAAYQPKQPFVGLAGIFIIVLVLVVSKIGNNKYATANRHFGFELYLDNKKLSLKKLSIEKYEIGWEQALRAWRVIQSAVFDRIYYSTTNTKWWCINKKFNYNRVKDDFKGEQWFDPRQVMGGQSSKWYPGRYLKSSQSTLFIFSFLSLIPLVIMSFQFQYSADVINSDFNFPVIYGIKIFSLISALITLISIITLLYKIRVITARRKLLEHGLLSIHSCAIMWQVVVIAHKRALKDTNNNQTRYLQNLSNEAENILAFINDIQFWIDQKGEIGIKEKTV